jgi:predicted nucleotidyltransferase
MHQGRLSRPFCFWRILQYDVLMTLDDVKRLIAPEVPALHACGVTALYVFGSVAAGTASPTSDVDVIVDYDPASGFDLIDLSGVHRRLSECLGAGVDVVTRDNIHRRIRDQVLKAAVRVF